MGDVIVEMGDVIAVASQSNILLLKENNRVCDGLQLKATVPYTGLQACRQLLFGQVWMISHQRKLSSN